ncbi:MAG: GNAT family N-acetyltransferase [Phycisphaerales bacterium]
MHHPESFAMSTDQQPRKHDSLSDDHLQNSTSKGVQIPESLLQPALERLISTGNPKTGAQRLIRNAKNHGIDLNLVWGVLGDPDQGQPAVRQVCMIVPGAGGTGMCFVSNPSINKHLGSEESQVLEIGACLRSALTEIHKVAGNRVRLAQMLFEPRQDWTKAVCLDAGMMSVGTLDYLRMDARRIPELDESFISWPTGVKVRPLNNLSTKTPKSDGSLLMKALERSYEGTLDCPELCGLRSMEDVLASHHSTGEFDPSRWWLLLKDDSPVGCCLLTHCPANDSVELVYLGICPSMQGQGLGKKILTHALKSLKLSDAVAEVTCAVDRRNIPASKVYETLGFKRFDARCGFVRLITPAEIEP